MGEHATYVYAVTQEQPALDELRGIGGSSVRGLPVEGLVALVSSVALAEFGAEPLRRNLEDLGWLEATARAHHEVVEASAALVVTAPLRLATVYHDDARVREMLEQRREELAAALARVVGRAEWGVKVYDDNATAAAPDGAVADDPAAGPGASYLRRRRLERDAAQQRGRAAAERAEAIHLALAATASASRRYPPQDQQLAGHSGMMMLNAAYLVDPPGAEALRGRIDELADGARYDLTGPWAPYSFAVLEQGS
ncbi:MAG: hypothetical protein GEV09_13790 [Pseudonocardiaceae bacterium]|nr:hypothetical protein [Pseudonocardiaceae bacterium]